MKAGEILLYINHFVLFQTRALSNITSAVKYKSSNVRQTHFAWTVSKSNEEGTNTVFMIITSVLTIIIGTQQRESMTLKIHLGRHGVLNYAF